MSHSKPWQILCAVIAATAGNSAALAQNAPATGESSPEEQVENSGQDPTRPVTRVDMRLKYQDGVSGIENVVLTARADKPFELGGGWKLNSRVDLPLVDNRTPSAADPDPDFDFGLGDVLLQALFIPPSHGKTTFAFGTQLIVPTGSGDRFTSGKWQLAPTAAVIYQLPEISRGTFVGVLLRDNFSFAGDDSRAGINTVSIQPIFNWQLPQRWFLTFGPEAKLNTKDNWSLFLPFDVTVGKKINPRTVISLQADAALVKDFPQYDWQAELRVGIFF